MLAAHGLRRGGLQGRCQQAGTRAQRWPGSRPGGSAWRPWWPMPGCRSVRCMPRQSRSPRRGQSFCPVVRWSRQRRSLARGRASRCSGPSLDRGISAGSRRSRPPCASRPARLAQTERASPALSDSADEIAGLQAVPRRCGLRGHSARPACPRSDELPAKSQERLMAGEPVCQLPQRGQRLAGRRSCEALEEHR